jgi:hypothetical protein
MVVVCWQVRSHGQFSEQEPGQDLGRVVANNSDSDAERHAPNRYGRPIDRKRSLVLLSVQDDPDIPSRRWRLNAFLTHV